MNGDKKFDCLACGQKTRTRDRDLVCPKCHKEYADEAGKALVRGEILSLVQWTLPKAEKTFKTAECRHQQKQEEFEALQREVGREAFEHVKKATGGKFVDRSVFNSAQWETRKELWRKKGGNRLYAELKTLESLVEFVGGAVKELKKNQNNRKKNNGISGFDPSDAQAQEPASDPAKT